MSFPPRQPSVTSPSRAKGLAGAGIVFSLGMLLPAQEAHYRTGVDVTSLNVTVLDPQNQPIGDLAREDFIVYENGVRQEIAYFDSHDLPTDLLLLIDTSASMRERLPFVRKTAADFTRALRPGDRGAVFDFNEHLEIRQPLTAQLSDLTREISTTQSTGRTALYDAIYIAVRQLTAQTERQGPLRRQVIVVVSDGEDNASLMTFQMLASELDHRFVTIYTIALQDEPPDDSSRFDLVGRRWRPRPSTSMQWVARQTGAVCYTPGSERELAAVYQTIGRELAHQYLLGYVPSDRAARGAFRQVNVQVVRPPGAKPRTRPGYVG